MDFDYTKIYKSPYPVPEEIIDSFRRKKLAFFIGAGVSRIIGCKGWEAFASSLLNECNRKKYITHLEYDSLKQEKDLKKIITIVYSIFYEKVKEEEFYSLFRESLKSDSEIENKFNIYSLLKRFETIYITTNADSHFDSFFSVNNCIYNFTKDMLIEQGKLYHIHGMESHPESLVFTIDQYLDRYNNDNFRDFLTKLFREYTIVFIGYGLGEYEVLDFLFEKARDKRPNEVNHFFVKAFFSHEAYMLKHERRYFDHLGVKIIGYEKDILGFAELYRLLEDWEWECHLSTTMIIEGLKNIEKKALIVETYNEIDELIKFIMPRDSFKKHFFIFLSRNIALAAKFFTYFIKNNYFDHKNNPPIREVEDNPGHFAIPYWDMLDYLLIINDYLKQKDEPGIIENLKIVLDNLILNSSNNRNYHTDRVLIILMFSLSEDNIENIYIKFLRTALGSNFGNSVISGTIYENVFPVCINFSNENIVKILEIILDSKEIENGYKDYLSLFDRYYLSQFIKNYLDVLSEKLGNELINIIINKLEKISDTALPLFGLDQLSINHAKSQIDETRYDQILVIALFCLINKLDKEERKKYIQKIDKGDNHLFKKISNLIANATETEIPQDDGHWDNIRTSSVSPYSTEELLMMNAEDIRKAMYINLPEFGWDSPSQLGFIESLRAMIVKAPNKITDTYQEYLHIPLRYKSAILSSLLDNARSKIPMNWEHIFCYLDEIIYAPDFIDIQSKSNFIYDMPILSAAADLIYYYFDGYIIDENFYNKLKKQLFYILSKVDINESNSFSDVGSATLNTSMGKSYYAIIKLVIFYGEQHNVAIDKWDKEIYAYLYSSIEKNSAHLILCYIFGQYFPLFAWLNKDFMFANFHLIMQNKNTEQWNAFISGFFYSNYELNNDIYILMKKNGIYEKAMNNSELSNSNRLMIIVHACIVYFRKLEDIENENTLLRKIIFEGNGNDIHIIKDFVWRRKEYFKSIDDVKVKKLWGIIVDCLSNERFDHNKEYENIDAELLSFFSVIKIVDEEIVRCAEFSITHCTENNLPFIISDLTLLFENESNRENILTILDMLLKRNVLFLYQEKEMWKFVDMIYQYKTDFANRICMAYLDRGYDFLLDIIKNDKLEQL